MSTEITVAIITSVASLVVAVVSLISSILSNRQSAHSARAIESLRFDFDRKSSTQTLSDKYLGKSLEALDALIQAIQRMKDVVYLILNAIDSSLDSESAIESISGARMYLFSCYEKQVPNLEDRESKGAHQAKNQALVIERRLREYLQGTLFVSELSDEQKQALSEFRNELTDIQNLLRDSKTTMLFERMRKYE